MTEWFTSRQAGIKAMLACAASAAKVAASLLFFRWLITITSETGHVAFDGAFGALWWVTFGLFAVLAIGHLGAATFMTFTRER